MKSLGVIVIFILFAAFLTPGSVFCQDDDAFWSTFALDGGISTGYPSSSRGFSMSAANRQTGGDSQKLKAIGGFPVFIGVGKVHFPHGRLESNFLSHPITHELAGVSKRHAAWDAFQNENDIQMTPDSFDNKSAGVFIDTPAELFPKISFSGGASYIADFSGNKIFQNETESGVQNEAVGGISAFLTIIFVDTVSIAAEYMTTTDKFDIGGLNPEFNQTIEPKAWNFELTFIPLTDMEVALRYGGSKDSGNFLHKIEYGGAIDLGLIRNTSLALEYIYKEFENKNTENSIAARFAVDF